MRCARKRGLAPEFLADADALAEGALQSIATAQHHRDAGHFTLAMAVSTLRRIAHDVNAARDILENEIEWPEEARLPVV